MARSTNCKCFSNDLGFRRKWTLDLLQKSPCKAPVNSLQLIFPSSSFCSISLIGVGSQEAFQLVFNAGKVFCALTYPVLFHIDKVKEKNAELTNLVVSAGVPQR